MAVNGSPSPSVPGVHASAAGSEGGASVPVSQPSTPPSHLPSVPDHTLLAPIASGSYGEVWLARNAVGTLRAVKLVRRGHFERAEDFEREFKGLQKFEPVSRSHDGLVDILSLGLLPDGAGFYYVMELADAAEPRGSNQCSVISNQSRSTSDQSPVGQCSVPPEAKRLSEPLKTDSLITDRLITDPLITDYSPRTLRAHFRARGALPAEEVIALGLQLTAALARLHGQGLVHRDIKPSNILFVGGVPKLADAGLVAAVDDARSLVGTVGYLAPEGPGSPQADLYALGKVLYEAAFGKDRQDFPQLPPDLASRPDHARLLELNAVIATACAHDPQQRYANAAALLADLQHLAEGRSVRHQQAWQRGLNLIRRLLLPGAVLALAVTTGWLLFSRFNSPTVQSANPAPSFPTLAVLPFDEEGAAAGDDLGARLTEEIRSGLIRVPGLGVIGRGSSEELKRSGQALALARSNQIDAILEGRVRRTADKVVVTVDLTEARSGRLLWSKPMESSSADPTAVAIVVVQGVLDPLNIRLSYSQRNSLGTRPTENLQAQRRYWEARALFAQKDGLEATLPKLHEAVELDPNFALAHADIAGVNITLAELCPRSPTNYWVPARIAAKRAFELAPDAMEANFAMAGLKETFEYDWAAAEAYYLRGVELNPASGEAHWIYGLFLAMAGRVAEARKHRELALQLDPLEPMNAMNMGHQLFEDEDRPEEALPHYLKAISKQPHAEKSRNLGDLYRTLGRDADALKAYEDYLLGSGISVDSAQELRMAYDRNRWTGYWQKWLVVMTQNPSKYYRWSDRAAIHDRLGQTNEVLECLKRSIENREFYATGIRNPNSWKPYRSDPRFQELLRMLRADEAGSPRLE